MRIFQEPYISAQRAMIPASSHFSPRVHGCRAALADLFLPVAISRLPPLDQTNGNPRNGFRKRPRMKTGSDGIRRCPLALIAEILFD
jgi:hypothetical protein